MEANRNRALMKSKLKVTFLFCFILTAPVTAQITIDGETVHVGTDNYEVQFNQGDITYIHNKLTDKTYTLSPGRGRRGWTGLLRHRDFWRDENISTSSHRTALVSATRITPLKAELLFRQDETDIYLFIEIDPVTDDLLIDMEGVSGIPGIVGMQWGCGYLDINNLSVILPIDGGRVLDATSTYQYHPYPSSGSGWEAQLAIVQGEHGGFYVRNTDNTLQFKRLIFNRLDDGAALHFGTYNQAPFDSYKTGQSQLWRFNTYAGDWRVPARKYRDWMEHAFSPMTLSEKSVEDVTLFVGSALNAVWLTNTEFLDVLATKVDPTKTVVMAKEWSNPQDWSINSANHHPVYEPMPELRNFLEVAKRHGFRVILYTDLHAFSVENPLYPQFMQYQYRDPWTGELLGYLWNTTHRHRYASMNPASSAFRELLVNELKPVWEAYDIDGFFLDTSYYVVNDANGLIDGLNSAQGGALLHKELAEAMPGAIFGGERLHEGTFALESFAQRTLLQEDMEPHPISAFLFSPFTHAIGYARTNPDADLVYHQKVLDRSEIWDMMPTLNAWDAKQLLQPEYVETQQVLASAGGWQPRYGLNGDVNNDGQVNILDLILVAQNFGAVPLHHLQADVNGDEVVNVLDLILVAHHLSQNATAPSQMNLIRSIPANSKEIIAVHRAMTELEAIPNKSQPVQLATELLRHYLSSADQYVQKPKLLTNYPNPFNPETWIPYQLAEDADVRVKIYDISGHLVRTIKVGHKPVGYYLTRERAVYWDGRNEGGESISSGVYFYTLITDHYTQTRRMVIVK